MPESEQYLVVLDEPFESPRLDTIAIALASDMKTTPEKMKKLLGRKGRLSRAMSQEKAEKLRRVFRRYHVPVQVRSEREEAEAAAMALEKEKAAKNASSPRADSLSPAEARVSAYQQSEGYQGAGKASKDSAHAGKEPGLEAKPSRGNVVDSSTDARQSQTRQSSVMHQGSAARGAGEANDTPIAIGRGGRIGREGRYAAAAAPGQSKAKQKDSLSNLNRIPDDLKAEQSAAAIPPYRREGRASAASQAGAAAQAASSYRATSQDGMPKDGEEELQAPVPADASLFDILGMAWRHIPGTKRFGMPIALLGIIVVGIAAFMFVVAPITARGQLSFAGVIIGALLPVLLFGFIFGIVLQLGWQKMALRRWWGESPVFADFTRFDGTMREYAIFQVVLTAFGLLAGSLALGFVFPFITRVFNGGGVMSVGGVIGSIIMVALITIIVSYVNYVAVYAFNHIAYRNASAMEVFRRGLPQALANGKMRQLFGLMVAAAIVSAIVETIFGAMGSAGEILFNSLSLIACFWLLPYFYLITSGIYLQENA